MLKLPNSPNTLTSRLLRCVSCREPFMVAQTTPQGKNRTIPDHHPHIDLRYQPNLYQRAVTPETRAEPKNMARASPPHPIQLVCPRCGADNSNWLQITTDTTPYYRRFRPAGVALPLALCFAAAVFTLLFVDPLLAENIPVTLRLAMVLFIFLSGFVTSWNPTRDWSATRDRINEERYLPKRKRPFSPLPRLILLAVTLAILLPLGLFAILPALIANAPALVAPPSSRTTIGRINSLLNEMTPEMVDQATPGQRTNLLTAAFGLQTAVNTKKNTCDTLPIQEAITTLTDLIRNTPAQRQERIPPLITQLTAYKTSNATAPCDTELLQTAITQLTVLQEIERSGGNATQCQQNSRSCYADVMQKLGTQVEQILASPSFPDNYTPYEQLSLALQNARSFQLNTPDRDTEASIVENLEIVEIFVQRQKGDIVISKLFFINWFVFVGIAATVGTAMGYFATEEYAKSINRHLPPPIYAAVANMTRVVIWEARRALEIQRTLGQIQWLEATRNDDGGITLVGIERDMPDYDNTANQFSDRIRAQKYHFVTDHLAHIITATVSDVQVRRSLAGPGFGFPGWEQASSAVPNSDNHLHAQDRRL